MPPRVIPKLTHPAPDVTRIPDTGLKLCKSCNHHHPLSDYHADRSRADGLDGTCNECKRARAIELAEAKRAAAGTILPPAAGLPPDNSTTQPPATKENSSVKPVGLSRVPAKTQMDDTRRPSEPTVSKSEPNVSLPIKPIGGLHTRKRIINHPTFSGLESTTVESIFEYAIKTLINRHLTEFKDICSVEADRLSRTSRYTG